MGEIRLDKMSGSGPGFYPALFLESGMKKQQNDFLNGSILPSLLRFAGPVLLALFLQAMYGAVDLIVVGKFAGSTSLAAGISSTSSKVRPSPVKRRAYTLFCSI